MKLLLTYIIIAFLAIFASQPKQFTENQPIKTIPIGYDLDKVGNDSVLVVKGQFTRQFNGRVYIKIN